MSDVWANHQLNSWQSQTWKSRFMYACGGQGRDLRCEFVGLRFVRALDIGVSVQPLMIAWPFRCSDGRGLTRALKVKPACFMNNSHWL